MEFNKSRHEWLGNVRGDVLAGVDPEVRLNEASATIMDRLSVNDTQVALERMLEH